MYIYLVSDVPTWYFKTNSRNLAASILCTLYAYGEYKYHKTISYTRKLKVISISVRYKKHKKHLPPTIYIYNQSCFCLVWVADSSRATHGLSRTGLGSKTILSARYSTKYYCWRRGRSPARSLRQVPLLRGDILVVSSQPLQIAQRDFGVRFMCV